MSSASNNSSLWEKEFTPNFFSLFWVPNLFPEALWILLTSGKLEPYFLLPSFNYIFFITFLIYHVAAFWSYWILFLFFFCYGAGWLFPLLIHRQKGLAFWTSSLSFFVDIQIMRNHERWDDGKERKKNERKQVREREKWEVKKADDVTPNDSVLNADHDGFWLGVFAISWQSIKLSNTVANFAPSQSVSWLLDKLTYLLDSWPVALS